MPADRRATATTVAVAAIGAALAGCGSSSGGATPLSAKLVTVGGQQRVVLSRESAARIGIRTATVRARSGRRRLVAIPYSALLYTADGRTFTYVRAAPLIFVHEPVHVADLTSSKALLSSGPAPGAAVVTAGGEELHGTETGIQEPE